MVFVGAEEALAAGAGQLGVDLDRPRLQEILRYATLLEKWNRTYNLTAVRDPREMLTLHLLDSLSIVPHLSTMAGRVLDVGSGGGLPGIPLAIACPGLSVTLLDSNSKKSAFQQQVVIELGLRNVCVVNARVENFRPAQPFDVIVSRAFSSLADFVGPTRDLLAAGGCWLAMKGALPRAELDALAEGVTVRRAIRMAVPGVDAERHLLVLQRTSETTAAASGA